MNLKLFLEHLLSEQAIDEEVNLRTAQAPTASEQSSDLDEAAVGVAQARAEQLAIVPGSKGGKSVILYKPNEILQEADRSLAEVNADQVFVEDFVGSKSIVASISCHKYSKNVYEVQLASANSGYGPLVYDLALSTLYPNFLISDRRSVSRSAEKVWKFYLNRRADVEKQPFKPAYNNIQDYALPALPNYEGADSLTMELEELEIDIEKTKEYIKSLGGIEKQKEQAYLLKIQNRYAKLKARRNEKLAKNPLSYMYRIKKPKSFTSLSNNHNKLMTQLKDRIPGFHSGNFLAVIDRQAEDWATMRIY